MIRKNRNRGYKKLTVWNDAIHYYVITCEVFRPFPYDLKRVASQQIASVDSVHRNIAEGYCRRSIKEYLNFSEHCPWFIRGIRIGPFRLCKIETDIQRTIRKTGFSGLQTRKWAFKACGEPGEKA